MDKLYVYGLLTLLLEQHGDFQGLYKNALIGSKPAALAKSALRTMKTPNITPLRVIFPICMQNFKMPPFKAKMWCLEDDGKNV